MGISIGDKPEMNVINVGDELTVDQISALQNAAGANADNPLVTQTELTDGLDAKSPLFDQSLNTEDFVSFAQLNIGGTTLNSQTVNLDGDGPQSVCITSTNDDAYIEVIAPYGKNGRVYVSGNSGSTSITNAEIVLSNGLQQVIVDDGGIQFPDSTVQGTAGISPATAASTYASFTGTNNFTGANTFITASGATVPLTVQNNGTGNSFVVNDETTPDSTPFVITAAGEVGIGKATPTSTVKLDVAGTARVTTAVAGNKGFEVVHGAGMSNNAVEITNLGSGNSFVVNDQTTPDSSPFVINANGDVSIGKAGTATGYKLDVLGTVGITTSVVGNRALKVTHPSGMQNNAVEIENLGTGNSFVVNDETPESTPFVIDASGNVVVGATTVTSGFKLDVVGSAKVSGGLDVGSIELGTTGIRFQAANVVRDIKPYTATAIGGETASYPHEIEIFVNNVLYRVPARVVT